MPNRSRHVLAAAFLALGCASAATACDEKSPGAKGTSPSASGSNDLASPAATSTVPSTPLMPAVAPPTPTATVAKPATDARDITLLVTGDEDGAFEVDESDPKHGAAAELSTKWIRDEHLCNRGNELCRDESTLALSVGDHAMGGALSTLSGGQAVADVLGRMGYSGSAFGNHDLDLGDGAFDAFGSRGRFLHTAANLTPKPGSALSRGVFPFLSFARAGIRIGVVGLANESTVKNAMANRFDGVTISPYETALASVIPRVWEHGVDALVVLAHDCPETLAPIVAKHADWHVALVVGTQCKKDSTPIAGVAKAVACGRRFTQYCRAVLHVDPKKPKLERVTKVDVTRVDVPNAEPDPQVQSTINWWAQRVLPALGEPLGVTKTGIANASPELVKIVLGAIRKQTGADVALANKKGFRGSFTPGNIGGISVYDAIPFENAVLVLEVPGSVLTRELARPAAVFEGAAPPFEATKKYKLATLDYLYFGGDGFDLATADPSPRETGMVWQTPVIDWLKKNPTTAANPLEELAKKL